METDNKKVISQFEFAIMEVADPEEAKKHRPRTDEEELELRKENLEKVIRQIKIK